MMTVRLAKPSELDEIFEMGYTKWGGGSTLEEYLTNCRTSRKYQRGKWWVLEDDDGSLVSSLIVYDLGRGQAGVGSLSTSPRHREQGYASKLLSAVLEKLEAQGSNVVFLFADITPSFYERLGFKPLPSKFQKHEGSVCMVKGTQPTALASRSDFTPPRYF